MLISSCIGRQSLAAGAPHRDLLPVLLQACGVGAAAVKVCLGVVQVGAHELHDAVRGEHCCPHGDVRLQQR